MSVWQTVTWETARTAGLVAYGLLTLAVALGLVLSLRWRSSTWPRWATNDLHRYVTLLALVFVGIHTLAVWLDPFMAFTPAEVLIPLASHYRPLWMAFGIVASYLLLAIWLSERVQRWIGYLWWRRLHYLTFGIYGMATIHGIATGSDTRTIWGMALYAGSMLLVGGLLAVRLLAPAQPMTPHPRVATLAGLAALVTVAWAVSGPLRPGWNLAANDGHGSGARIALAAGGNRRLTVPFTAQLQGSATADGAGSFGVSGLATVRVATTVSGGAQGTLTIVLQGQPTPNGLAVQGGQVRFVPGGGETYQGQVTEMDGGALTAVCTTSNGDQLRLTIQLQIDGAGDVSGTVQGSQI